MKPIRTEDAGNQEAWEVFIVRGDPDRFFLIKENALKHPGVVVRWNRWLGRVTPIRGKETVE